MLRLAPFSQVNFYLAFHRRATLNNYELLKLATISEYFQSVLGCLIAEPNEYIANYEVQILNASDMLIFFNL